MTRAYDEIMQNIFEVYMDLSPENISCDGEASKAYINKQSRRLNACLKELWKEIGHDVEETEVYQWHDNQRQAKRANQ